LPFLLSLSKCSVGSIGTSIGCRHDDVKQHQFLSNFELPARGYPRIAIEKE
jgi:hypothetical protein